MMRIQTKIKGFLLAGCVAFLFSCDKQKIYYNAGSDDEEDVPTISGTKWTSVMPEYLEGERIMAMAVTSDDRMLLTFIKSVYTSGLYDGSVLQVNNQSLGSGTGFEEIEFINSQPYGLGQMDMSGAFSFDVTDDFQPWTPVEYLGTKAFAFAEFEGKKVIACSNSPYVRINNSGSTYNSMASGLNGQVYDLVNYQGKLIAAGSFTFSGSTSVKSVAQWNGSSWQPMGSGLGGTIRDLVVYKDKVIALGSFNLSGSKRFVAAWDGASWNSLGEGLDGGSTAIKGIVSGNELIIGGSFDGSGSVYSPNIIKWNGSAWLPLAGGNANPVGEMCVYKGKLHIANEYESWSSNFLLRLD